MTRYFILAASFVLLFSYSPAIVNATEKMATENSTSSDKYTTADTKAASDNHGKASSASANAKTHMPIEKHHSSVPTMDETPHIHHYHKERVKKVKKHHTKIWYLSMFLIAVCQVSLLIIAYMHVTH